jgi:hypothetical protein
MNLTKQQRAAVPPIVQFAGKTEAEAAELVSQMPADQVTALVAAARDEAACRKILGLADPNPPAAPAIEKTKPGRKEPPKKERIHAGPCDRVPTHKNTRVYNTKGRVRFCVCDDCGATWKKTAAEAVAS